MFFGAETWQEVEDNERTTVCSDADYNLFHMNPNITDSQLKPDYLKKKL